VTTRLIWAAIALVIVLRAVAAFTLPLTGDEAYYWEWSRRLAFGYVDHPPAVAWTIAAFAWLGHQPGFVRLGFVLCGVVASLALAAATAETGLPAISVTVPGSVSATAQYGVVPRTTATFVFNASLAVASAASIGRTAPPMPAKLDGSTLVITGGPAIMVTYGTEQQGNGTLIAGVAKAPTVSSDGASVAEIQAYLLSQPSVSPALAAQIRAIGDPASTLPIPIPVGQAAAKNVTVHGTSGLFVGDSTGLGSGVLWQQNGFVYVVGGTLTEAETLAAANSLK